MTASVEKKMFFLGEWLGAKRKSRIVSNYLWTLVSEGFTRSVFFVTTIYLTRILGVGHFGSFAFAQVVTSYLLLGVNLGLNLYGVREIARDKANAEPLIRELLTIRVAAGVLVFLVYISVLFFIQLTPLEKMTYTGCGIYILAFSLYPDWVFKGYEKFRTIMIGSVISSLSYLTGVFFLVKRGDDVAIAAYVWSLSSLAGSAALLVVLYRHFKIAFIPSFHFRNWLGHLRHSIFFTVSNIITTLGANLPLLFLSVFHTTYQVGLYAAPMRIVGSISTLGMFLPMAFYPVLSEKYASNRTSFLRTHRALFLIMFTSGLCASLIGTVWSSSIILFFFGSAYGDSILVFRVIVWLIFVQFVRSAFGYSLFAMGLQRYQVLSASTALVLHLALGLLLVPVYGIRGGAAASLAAESASAVVAAFYYWKHRSSEWLPVQNKGIGANAE